MCIPCACAKITGVGTKLKAVPAYTILSWLLSILTRYGFLLRLLLSLFTFSDFWVVFRLFRLLHLILTLNGDAVVYLNPLTLGTPLYYACDMSVGAC